MNTNQLHPLAREIVHRIHGGEPADRIIEALRQDRRLPTAVRIFIRELADAEHRLERLRVQAQQADEDAERLVVELNEAVQVASEPATAGRSPAVPGADPRLDRRPEAAVEGGGDAAKLLKVRR